MTGKKKGHSDLAPHGQAFFGFTGSQLENASRFDVDYGASARSAYSSLSPSVMMHADKPLNRHPVLHHRYGGWFDTSDFDGLA